MRKALEAIRAARLDDWLAAFILALAVVGCVEAPWIAPHFVQENHHAR